MKKSRAPRDREPREQDRHRDRIREDKYRQHQDPVKEEQVRQHKGERDKKDHHSYPPEPCDYPLFKTSLSEIM